MYHAALSPSSTACAASRERYRVSYENSSTRWVDTSSIDIRMPAMPIQRVRDAQYAQTKDADAAI